VLLVVEDLLHPIDAAAIAPTNTKTNTGTRIAIVATSPPCPTEHFAHTGQLGQLLFRNPRQTTLRHRWRIVADSAHPGCLWSSIVRTTVACDPRATPGPISRVARAG
jgi:hypothetical protein